MYENFEKCQMFICYIESGRNSEDALNLYFERYPERQQPSEQIFPRLENALMNYGSFVKPRPKQYAIEGRDEVEAEVIGAVLENPEISTREITVTKGVSKSRSQRILKKYKYKPYKVRLTHQIFPGDQERRINFCNWFIRKCNENENFHRNVIWTDEARVTSNGIFNRHNRHRWSDHNEHVFQPRNMQGRFGFNIWIGIVRQRMIGPFIYDENLNAQRYVNILENIVEPYLEDLPLADLVRKFYQQDGAPAHNAAVTRNKLNQMFEDRWMGTRGPIPWPARSPDLSPLDFFIWGFVKDQIFKTIPETRQDLEQRVRNTIAGITPLQLLNAEKSVKKRCQFCIDQNGRQFEHYL